MLIAARVHPFPYRTRKLSSLALKILGGKLPGKISRCQHKACVFKRIRRLFYTNKKATGQSQKRHSGCFFGGCRTEAALLLQIILKQCRTVNQYIPPACAAAAAAAFAAAASSFLSATRLSVVRTIAATDAAFSRAERVTLVGSTMPASIISV